MDREIVGARPGLGVGQGWRLNARGRRYSVAEPPPVSLTALISESDRMARHLGCTCVFPGADEAENAPITAAGNTQASPDKVFGGVSHKR